MFNNKASWTWNIYLQHPRPHNKSTTIPSIRNVRVPNVISVISKHDKSDDETMNAPYLSHWTISIVTTALRRLLHLYCLPFRPCSGHTRSKSEQNGRHTQSETVLGASRASKIPCRLDSSGISPFIRYIYYFLHCFFCCFGAGCCCSTWVSSTRYYFMLNPFDDADSLTEWE